MIAIGGLDRAGKSLQRRLLLEHLAERGCDAVHLWTRLGYTPRLEAAKRLARRLRRRGRRETAAEGSPRSAEGSPRHEAKSSARPGERSPRYPARASRLGHPLVRRLWTTLALLDLFLVHAVEIRRLRARGRAVVCDRGLCDALVDLRVNFPGDRVEERLLWQWLVRFAVRPDATFLLLAPVEELLRRARQSGRRHVEPAEVLAARLAEYRRLAACGAAEAIDASHAPDHVARLLRERVDRLLVVSRAGRAA